MSLAGDTRLAAERIFERIKAADKNIDRLKCRAEDYYLVRRAEDHRVGLVDALHAIGWRVNYRNLVAGELRPSAAERSEDGT